MSEIWYKASARWGVKIEPVQVISSTEKRLKLAAGEYSRERTVSKENSWGEAYFPTWEGAHTYVVAQCTEHVARLRRELELANSKLGNAKGMRP